KLGVAHLVRFLGGRNDVPGFLLAADLLVHPAYHENTGTVLLEAMIAGLPVLTVDSCGYAHYVNEARAGRVLPSPFCQNTFNQTLQQMLVSPERLVWRQQGLQFGQEADIYSMPERAVACIEQLGKRDLNIQHLSFTQMMKPQGDCFRAQLGRRTQRILREGKAYFIKQHVGVGWKEIIKNLLQLRLPIVSANNEYQAIQKLQTLTVPVPTVVRYACRGWNPARLQSFLLTEEIAHQGSLEQYCQTWRQIPPTFTLKQALLKEVARIARVMHAHGINHRDFYLCHFLLDGSVDIAKCVKLYLIDLHRAQIRKKVPKRWLIKDLAGLYFSSKDIGLTRRDIYRFIQYYRQQPLHEVFALEPAFWQQVQQRGEKLYGKHQHSRNSLFTENS
ncbi:MAG: Lipopolysaccharide kinase (Kdo/WaaP) family protein, partial [uncultured bacterium]